MNAFHFILIVLGVREVNMTSDNYLPLSMDDSNTNESSLKDPLACCHLHPKPNDDIEESGSIYAKCKHKIDLTCAQFYEEKICTMLEIFSEVMEKFSLYSN